MAYTTDKLAKLVYAEKVGLGHKESIVATYHNKGVLINKYWEYKGHHQKKLDTVFMREGKIYQGAHMTPSKIIGTYTELN